MKSNAIDIRARATGRRNAGQWRRNGFPTRALCMPAIVFMAMSCSNQGIVPDASGTFEADEVIVSAELNGKILSLDVEEGDMLARDSVVGRIDAVDVSLQKDQVMASINALSQRTTDLAPHLKLIQDQLLVQQSQVAHLQKEKTRIENLLKQDAATGKQLDDIGAQLDAAVKQEAVIRQQISAQKSSLATQNRSVLSEAEPLRKRAEQLDEQLARSYIVNPVSGTALAKYAQAGEITAAGKALYKIADLSILTLRAYVSGSQLSQIKLGQPVTVLTDAGEREYKKYAGTISWISDKAEFTPKTIQTKEERSNLVYAIKVRVKNDGYLKIGMYGEILLNAQEQ